MKATAEFRSRYQLVSYYNVFFPETRETREFCRADSDGVIKPSHPGMEMEMEMFIAGVDAVLAYMEQEHERYLAWRQKHADLFTEENANVLTEQES
jgi:hypothetical protein